MTYRPSLSVIFGVGATALVLLATACVSTPQTPAYGPEASAPDEGPGAGIDDYILVDCKLPGQVRQLGTTMTYLAPRRPIKATKSDCAIRGGEFVLFDRSDYKTALVSLLPPAHGGEPIAQYYVGEIYEKGLGLAAPDYPRAVSWYRKAAANNYTPAQTSLGSMYERGLGVPRDKAQALNWYRKATGLTQDQLVFSSVLEAEREKFKRELAVRNRTAESLQHKLSETRRMLNLKKEQVDEARNTSQSTRETLTSSVLGEQEAARLRGQINRQRNELAARQSDLNALQTQYEEERHQLESQRRDAESEAERLSKELRALKALKAKESTESMAKSAQLGKLELVRNEQFRAMLETKKRLAASP